MPSKDFSYADPDMAGAYIFGLSSALIETLQELRDVYGAEWKERMAEFEARVVKEIKNTGTERLSEEKEVRLLTAALDVVAAAFEQARGSAKG